MNNNKREEIIKLIMNGLQVPMQVTDIPMTLNEYYSNSIYDALLSAGYLGEVTKQQEPVKEPTMETVELKKRSQPDRIEYKIDQIMLNTLALAQKRTEQPQPTPLDEVEAFIESII